MILNPLIRYLIKNKSKYFGIKNKNDNVSADHAVFVLNNIYQYSIIFFSIGFFYIIFVDENMHFIIRLLFMILWIAIFVKMFSVIIRNIRKIDAAYLGKNCLVKFISSNFNGLRTNNYFSFNEEFHICINSMYSYKKARKKYDLRSVVRAKIIDEKRIITELDDFALLACANAGDEYLQQGDFLKIVASKGWYNV